MTAAGTRRTALSLDDETLGKIVESGAAVLGHDEGGRDLDAPARFPDAGNAMKGHVRLEHGLVAGPQARRVLAPIGRVGEAEGIADAAFLADAVFADDAAPGGLDVFRGGAGL